MKAENQKHDCVYGFVVLHYIAEDMTKECVRRILALFSSENIKIVVVDNASPNGSGARIKEYFAESDVVTTILSSENLGFAKGNNLGFDLLKNEYNPDFMIVMNNDVLISDACFLRKVSELYNNNHYAVLAPDINNPRLSKHQNPFSIKGLEKSDVEQIYRKLKKNSEHFLVSFFCSHIKDKIRFNKFIRRLYEFFKYGILKKENLYKKELRNIVPHGSCLIFSRNFISKRKYAFNPCTFLYFEENILYQECITSGLDILYSPVVFVDHLEDVSTGKVFNSDLKKERYKLKQMIKSCKVFLDLFD